MKGLLMIQIYRKSIFLLVNFENKLNKGKTKCKKLKTNKKQIKNFYKLTPYKTKKD